MKVLLDLNVLLDAVVASLAEAAQCGHIITRNEADFASSPVPAVSPTAFLALLAAAQKPADGGETAGHEPPH